MFKKWKNEEEKRLKRDKYVDDVSTTAALLQPVLLTTAYSKQNNVTSFILSVLPVV